MKKENNSRIILGIVGIIVLVGVFYVGVSYGKSQIPVRDQGAQAFGSGNFAGGAGTRGTRTGEFTTGEIISKDATSMTVKLLAGGSKIIFLNSSAKITKSVDGSLADLAIGTQVSVSGTLNPDGSINGQSVQIRPNIVPPVVK
jgi:hypothetical protein